MTRRGDRARPGAALWGRFFATAGVALSALLLYACAPIDPVGKDPLEPVRVRLIAFNDFHGYLEPPGTTIAAPDPAHPGAFLAVRTGGAAELATLVRTLAAGSPNHLVVGAGDMVGASPLVSGLFLDEPSIEALDAIGLQITSVGNHEFDRGVAELLRKQHGGCEQVSTLVPCKGGHPFAGAHFHYLAANVIDRSSGTPILPGYEIRRFEGQAIAFIGVTLRGTGRIVDPGGVRNVEFTDEADSANAIVRELRGQGIHSFVLLIHQGGESPGPLNQAGCPHFEGDLLPILKRLDPDISVVVSGHTHQPYVCALQGFLVTSAASYSRLVTDIELSIDRASGRVISKSAMNLVVAGASGPGAASAQAYPPIVPAPDLVALVAGYANLARPLASRPVGRIEATLRRLRAGEFECSLGDVIADAQWAATRTSAKAQLAFTNPGGIRTDLGFNNDGSVSYGEVFAAQPFGNSLVTETLTGAQIKRVLEQQWSKHAARPLFLQVSQSFQYAFDPHRPVGDRVLAQSLRIDGQVVDPEHGYRVTVNSFLAAGGDDFSELAAGTDMAVGELDADALEQYLGSHSPLAVPAAGRIVQLP